MSGARAEDASPPASQQQPAATPSPSPSGQKGGAGRGTAATPPPAAEQHRLPPDSTTKQTLALPGRTLDFTATAGSIRLFDDKGEPQADIAYTSYQLDGTDRASRPVTFLFNGGPGASSAWLQFGDAGPWRLSITGEGAVASASPDLLPNAETWLDFTDLVFIDPVGTGYSRFVASGEDARKRFYSVDGDVSAIALVIRRWLEKYDRLLSPKFVAGESYGGIRGPKIVRNLQTQQGVGVRGLIMVSPLFDYPRIFRLEPAAIHVHAADHGGGGARSQGAGDARRSRRCRALRARRVSRRSHQGAGRHRGHDAARRQGGRVDRHRSGGEPQAGRAFRGRRIPPGVRPPQRQGDRTLRRLGVRLRSLSGFELLSFRRSLRRFPDGAADQRRRRTHHAQAELAAGRLVSPAQRVP